LESPFLAATVWNFVVRRCDKFAEKLFYFATRHLRLDAPPAEFPLPRTPRSGKSDESRALRGLRPYCRAMNRDVVVGSDLAGADFSLELHIVLQVSLQVFSSGLALFPCWEIVTSTSVLSFCL
jgi:hypothetical protein